MRRRRRVHVADLIDPSAATNHVPLTRQYAVLQELLHGHDACGEDLQAMVVKAAETCREGLAVDRVSIWLKDRAGDSVEMVAVSEEHEVLRPNGTRLAVGDSGLLTGALTQGDVLVADDAHEAPHLRDLLRRHRGIAEIKSRLDVPIILDGAIAGVMIVSMVRHRIRWETEQIQFARDIAAIVSLGVERRSRRTSEGELVRQTEHLVAEVERREQRERAMKRNQQVLTRLLRIDLDADRDVRADLQVLSETVRETLDIQHVSIWIGNENTLDGVVVAASERDGRPVSRVGAVVALQAMPRYLAALQTCQPLATTAPATAPHLAELILSFPKIRESKARIDVPVLRDGQLVGAIVGVETDRPLTWSSEDVMLLTAVSGIAAILIERRQRQALECEREVEAQARDATRRTLERNQNALRLLLQDSRDDIAELSPALERLCDAVRNSLDVDRVALWLCDDETGSYRQVAARERGGAVPLRVAVSFTAADAPTYISIMQCGEPISTEDAAAAPHLQELGAIYRPVTASKSRVDVPIVRNGVLIGMIIATDRLARRQWSAENLMLMSAVSGIAALLLERHQRRAIEVDLRRANDQARAASNAKSLFLANMSHELRTPMNGVFGMTDLLLRTELSSRQHRLVQTINTSARTLLTIINDVLDLSRIEAGKLVLDVQDFDLLVTLEGAVELFAEDARKKGLALSLFVSPDVPASLIGDAGRLRQICINLIGNAIKFTQSGAVAVRVIAGDVVGGRRQIIIEVRDTGIGIAPEVQSSLFQPFAQADSSISRQFGGTGLGLSISKHLAEQMGGRVLLCSAPGDGTTIRFDVRLPLGTGAAATFPAVLAGKRVLVVDAHGANRELVVHYLTACGVDCISATSAADAFGSIEAARIAGLPFAAIVAGLAGSDCEAADLLHRLAADARHRSLGMVAVALPSMGDIGLLPRSIGPELLAMPVRRDDLLEAVVRAMSTGNARRLGNDERQPVSHRAFSGRILLAEDNPVNVLVAREYLDRLGIDIDVAADGREAVDMLAAPHAYDAVLMDCQMPTLDGLEATRRIRSMELDAHRQRVPIIAVTANAYEADRVACIDAGMDDYLAKPYTEDALVRCLEIWMPRRARRDFDPAAPLIDDVAHGPQVLARLRDTFMAHSPRIVTELTEAAAMGNVAALQGAAHSLRSSSATIGAQRLAHLCAGLEAAAQRHDTNNAVARVRDIAAEFRSVSVAIAALAGSS